MDQQQQFATFTNNAPQIIKTIDEGLLGSVLNGALEKAGNVIGACHQAVLDLGKSPLFSMGKSLEGDVALMPASTPSKGNTPSERGQSQQIELSRVPELQIAMEKSGASNLAQGLKCEHCDRGDSGLLASPYTPSTGINKSQSIGLG